MQNQPMSPEIRLQVACSLPSNLHVSKHPNLGHFTEYRKLFKIFLLPGVFLNKNTNSKFDLFVEDASFQFKTARLQLFQFCKLSSMGLSGFCAFSSEKSHFCGFHSTTMLVHIESRIHFIL